jgi:hypothetical protein
VITPVKTGHEVKLFSAIQVDSRSWFFRMPDQGRHEEKLWTLKLIIKAAKNYIKIRRFLIDILLIIGHKYDNF